MPDYMELNRELWDEITPIHEKADLYDIEGFKAGKTSLKQVELSEVGEVAGKSLLHLMCHIGLDSISWARLGAKVTAMDFSPESIKLARSLSREIGVDIDWIQANIYDLPRNLKGQFDVVFTSYGVLCWLPDLKRWAEIIAHFLKPGGFFYIVEGHPALNIFDNSSGIEEFKVTFSYFENTEPNFWGPCGDYTDRNTKATHGSYEWTHPLSAVVNSLIEAGLKIEFLHEFPFTCYQWSDFTKKSTDDNWHVKGDNVPLQFSLKASKPE